MRSFPQRFLEMLPPKALGEIIEFITANGYNTTTIIRTGQRMPDALRVAFWPLDSYSNAESRQHALTAMSQFIASFDAQVTYGEEATENYWQVLSALTLGSNQDSEFKKFIANDDMFDTDESSDDADRFLSKEEMAALEATPGYKAASAVARKALKDNVDFLTEVRKYGEALSAMMERNQDRKGYIGSFAIRRTNSVFGGDPDAVDVGTARNEVRMLVGDILGETLTSNDPAYTGGIGKFLKKGFKAIGKVAKFVPGLSGPMKLVSLASGLKGKKRAPAPAADEGFIMPDAQPETSNNNISLNQPEGKVLYGFARKYLSEAQNARAMGDIDYGSGDVLDVDDNGGVSAVAFPSIVTPQGDVLEATGEGYLPTEFTGGMLLGRLKGRMRAQAVSDTAKLVNELRATISMLRQRGVPDADICRAGDMACQLVTTSRNSGDPLDAAFVGGLNDWLELGRTGMDYVTAREQRKAAEAASRAGLTPVTYPVRPAFPGAGDQDALVADATKRMYDSLTGSAVTRYIPGGNLVLLAGAAWATARKALGSSYWRAAPDRVLARWNTRPHSVASKKFFGDSASIPAADGLGDM